MQSIVFTGNHRFEAEETQEFNQLEHRERSLSQAQVTSSLKGVDVPSRGLDFVIFRCLCLLKVCMSSILHIYGWWFQRFFIFQNTWDNPSH